MNNMNIKLLNEYMDQELYEELTGLVPATLEDIKEHVLEEILEDQLKEMEEYEN